MLNVLCSRFVYLQLLQEGRHAALSHVRTLNGLRIEHLDYSKLSGKTQCNKEAITEMERL